MSVSENRALHESAACRQEEKTSRNPTNDCGYLVFQHEVGPKPDLRGDRSPPHSAVPRGLRDNRDLAYYLRHRLSFVAHVGRTGPAAEPHVSVRALILALARFGIASRDQARALEKAWAEYRTRHRLDIEGKVRSRAPGSCAH